MSDFKPTVVIGDLHGRTVWRQIVADNPGCHVVFLGDYFDCTRKHYYSPREQVENFKAIVDLKISRPDEVTLLWGNHDFHYLRGLPSDERYSGMQHHAYLDIQEVLEINAAYLDVCRVSDGVVYSHAGLSDLWVMASLASEERTEDRLQRAMNELFIADRCSFGFVWGTGAPDGDHPLQGPLWIRPMSLSQHAYGSYLMVVGHTGPLSVVRGMEFQHDRILMADSFSLDEPYYWRRDRCTADARSDFTKVMLPPQPRRTTEDAEE